VRTAPLPSPLAFLLLVFSGWINRRQQAVIGYTRSHRARPSAYCASQVLNLDTRESCPSSFTIRDGSDKNSVFARQNRCSMLLSLNNTMKTLSLAKAAH
jgi:hypothetical protein